MARLTLDMLTLDVRLHEELAKHRLGRGISAVVWRHPPDASGSNWNAGLRRIDGTFGKETWGELVRTLRDRYNLKD